MAAERDVNKSCTEASKTPLSANQPIQLIPASGRRLERRFSLPVMMSMAPFSPDLHPSIVREPPPLILLDGNPLEAMSQPQSTESRIRIRALRKQWDYHQRLNSVKVARTETVKDPMEVLPTIPRAQTSTGPLQEEPVTMKLPAGSHLPHRLLTKMEIEQDMLELKEGISKVDKQQLEQPYHSHNQPVTEHKQTSNVLGEITDQAHEIKEPAYIPTITITGYSHQTSHSAFLPDGSIDPDRLLPLTVTQQDESNYSALAVISFENSSGGFHSNPSMSSKQSPTSSAETKTGGEPQADTTSLEKEAHKMQLAEGYWEDRLTATAVMPVPEDDSLHKSTFTQGQVLQAANQGKNSSVANQEVQQLVTEKGTNPADHQMQVHNLPEENRVHQEHKDEDDTESLLLKETNPDESKSLNSDSGEKNDGELEDEEDEDEDDEEPLSLQHFLRYLKDWIWLYWETVWPMLDPRTLRVEHEGPMTWWEACLLIGLTAPAVALAHMVIVQMLRFVMFMVRLREFVDDGSAI